MALPTRETRPLTVVGTRTYAAEVSDFARDAGFEVVGVLEAFDRTKVGQAIDGVPVTWLEDAAATTEAIVGTGDVDRRAVVERLLKAGWSLATIVHPTAHVSRTARVGRGTIVGPGVIVGAMTSIGDNVVIGRGSLIGHHTVVNDFVTLSPGANVAGNVQLGAGAFVGMSAAVRDHLTIGAAATVAMGAVVVKNVDPGVRVQGVPALPASD